MTPQEAILKSLENIKSIEDPRATWTLEKIDKWIEKFKAGELHDWLPVMKFIEEWHQDYGRWIYEHLG